MFFQEYFGVFENDYSDTSNIGQSAQLYVAYNSNFNAYLGDTVLPTGVNPFVPQPPTPPSPNPEDDGGLGTAGVVCLIVLGVALAGFFGFLLYKYYANKAAA